MTPRKETPIATRQAIINMRENGMRATEIAMMPEEINQPRWPMHLFYIMTIIAIPVYLIVLISLLKLRTMSSAYNTTFYTLFLQHSIGDILTTIAFYMVNPLRNIPFLKKFYYDYQDYYIAAACYNSIYYFLYVRCSGIILLSLHRYISISMPTSRLTMRVQHMDTWKIVIIFWTIPTLMSIVALKDTDFHYDNPHNLMLIAPREIIDRNTLMALIVVLITCLICSLCYGALFYVVRAKRSILSRTLRREMHLAVQVFVLLIAFFGILVYYAFQNYFAQTQNNGPIFIMRAIYPIASGFLSFINPFCILVLNREFANHVKCFLRFNKMKVEVKQPSTTLVTTQLKK